MIHIVNFIIENLKILTEFFLYLNIITNTNSLITQITLIFIIKSLITKPNNCIKIVL